MVGAGGRADPVKLREPQPRRHLQTDGAERMFRENGLGIVDHQGTLRLRGRGYRRRDQDVLLPAVLLRDAYVHLSSVIGRKHAAAVSQVLQPGNDLIWQG